jgi:hypothetical protein
LWRVRQEQQGIDRRHDLGLADTLNLSLKAGEVFGSYQRFTGTGPGAICAIPSPGKLRYAFAAMPRPAGVLSLLLLGLLTLFPSLLPAQQVLPGQGLDEMVAKSERILQAQVTGARLEPHPQFSHLKTVLVTLRVQDTLKGKAGETVQFRQYVWGLAAMKNAGGYTKGENLLLFLNPVSQYGLTSPVGLAAGSFHIERKDNKTVAVNGNGNAGLFRSTERRAKASGVRLSQPALEMIRTTTAGPVPLDTLKETIRALVRGN